MEEVLVAFDADPGERAAISHVLGQLAQVRYLTGAFPRDDALRSADVVIAGNLRNEIQMDEFAVLAKTRLLQILPAGANRIPFNQIRDDVTIASNVGAYAEPMAEHVLAMTLALAKNLVLQDRRLLAGEWGHREENRSIKGLTAGILGFGGIGRATASLLRSFEMRIMAITRTGEPDAGADYTGTLEELRHVFSQSDIVVVALPLTNRTRGLIGREQLEWMKDDAILINVARGALIEEMALYHHAKTHRNFRVGLDVWWDEPFTDGKFHTRLPILELPNVIGSPHNSGNIPGVGLAGVTKAAENVRRFLTGERVTGVVDRSEYI